MSDIDDLKDAVQHSFITPLQNFRAHAQALDTNYNQCVKAFQDAIGSLFHPGPGPTFSGKAADTLAELAGNYLTSEQAISDYYISNSLSTHLGQAAAACDQAIASVEPLLSSLVDTPGIGAAGAIMTQTENTTEEAPPGPWDVPIVLGGIAIAGGAFFWAQTQQDNQIRAIWNDIDAWKLTMRGIAGQIESKLPPTPTDPQPFTPANAGVGPVALDDQQEQTAQELLQEFGGDVSLDDIRDIISRNPGLTKDQYRLLIKKYQQTGSIPFSVVAIGVAYDGTIVYVTETGIEHIRNGHRSDFQHLSDQQLADLLVETLKENPDRINGDRYLYKRIRVKVKAKDLVIVVSTSVNYDGMVITSYIPVKQPPSGR